MKYKPRGSLYYHASLSSLESHYYSVSKYSRESQSTKYSRAGRHHPPPQGIGSSGEVFVKVLVREGICQDSLFGTATIRAQD